MKSFIQIKSSFGEQKKLYFTKLKYSKLILFRTMGENFKRDSPSQIIGYWNQLIIQEKEKFIQLHGKMTLWFDPFTLRKFCACGIFSALRKFCAGGCGNWLRKLHTFNTEVFLFIVSNYLITPAGCKDDFRFWQPYFTSPNREEIPRFFHFQWRWAEESGTLEKL